jgi:hypothetical protein
LGSAAKAALALALGGVPVEASMALQRQTSRAGPDECRRPNQIIAWRGTDDQYGAHVIAKVLGIYADKQRAVLTAPE